MPRTYTQLLAHIVFSTKGRSREIGPGVAPKLHGYLWGICKNCRFIPFAVNGAEDHVHLLVGTRPDNNLSDFVRDLKSSSSKWVHEEFGKRLFAWQLGFSAFSVSKSNAKSVIDYIRDQQTHHARITFQDELIALLRKHGVEYDERYIWQ